MTPPNNNLDIVLHHFAVSWPYKIPKSIPYAALRQFSRHKSDFWYLISLSYLIFVIFFTQAKFLENKIYTKIYTVNCQFTQ